MRRAGRSLCENISSTSRDKIKEQRSVVPRTEYYNMWDEELGYFACEGSEEFAEDGIRIGSRE